MPQYPELHYTKLQLTYVQQSMAILGERKTRRNGMFRVGRFDVTGNFYSTWDTFDEANAEYERQVHNCIGYKDDQGFVSLVVVLRTTIKE